MYRHVQKPGIISYENSCQRCRQSPRTAAACSETPPRSEAHCALAGYLTPFYSCAVVIADNWSYAGRITDENRKENKIHIHDGSVSCDSVFSRVAHQLRVIQHADNGHGNTAHQFRYTVGAGTSERSSIPIWLRRRRLAKRHVLGSYQRVFVKKRDLGHCQILHLQ